MTGTPRLLVLACALLALLLPACASSRPGLEPLAQPYRVVLLPIEGVEAALAGPRRLVEEVQEGEEVPFFLAPDEFRARITETIADSGVFSSVRVADPVEVAADEFTDAVVAATPLAKAEAADLIMRVRVNSARLRDLGANSSQIWSTASWFMVPLPIWTVNDRTYATSLTVQAELFDPNDPVKPTASVVASSGEQELDLWDRGISPLVAVVPPPFLKGDLESVSETLTERAVEQLLVELVHELRTREIPSRFEFELAWSGRDLVFEVRSRRRLRSVVVMAGDSVLREWSEDETIDLLVDTPSGDDLTVYRATVKDAESAGEYLRVLVEDEAGGREVRTIPAPSVRAVPTIGPAPGTTPPTSDPAPAPAGGAPLPGSGNGGQGQ